MERTKLGLSKDKMYKALGEGERTSKKVSSIRMSDGSTFKRKNANQYGAAEGGNDYTEKRSNRTDRFDLGGTADSSNSGANMGGTMGSSVMKRGGEVGKFKIGDVVYNKKQKTIGIVRNIFDKNDLRTDADGVVDMDILEIYNKSNPKHQKGKIANSTRMELANKKANGGGLSDLPENPNNDAISYKDGGSVNGTYLNTISSDKKSKILNNIAKQYGISVKNAEEEVKDTDAEMLYEYIANDQHLRMDIYNDFKKNKYANGGGLANTPESFPSNDAVSYKTGGRIKKITEWSISTNNEDKHFDNYKDAKDFWNNLDKKEKETGQFFKKSYINGEEDDVEILDGKLSGYANGGTTKSFEYTIGGL